MFGLTGEQEQLRKEVRAFAEREDVKLCTIGEGTSEIQRMVIARELPRGV